MESQKPSGSLCIPLFRPNEDFFSNLQSFLSQNFFIELIIIETIEGNSSPNNKERIIQIATSFGVKLRYQQCEKSEFTHGTSRNSLFELSSCNFVVFVTQDIEFAPNLELRSLISQFDTDGLDAISVRHYTRSPVFTNVFDQMFTTLSQIDYTNCQPRSVLWWSHNFAIYKRETILSLKFPEISFAEDLYWAKLARSNGFRLKIILNQGIVHQNLDSIGESYRRGILEAMGHFEGHLTLGLTVSKLPLLKRFLFIFQSGLRLVSKLTLKSFLGDYRLILGYVFQQIGFSIQWNALVKSRVN
jgi:hypothetical protein